MILVRPNPGPPGGSAPQSEVVRIASIYLGVAWLGVQVAHTLEEALEILRSEPVGDPSSA